jgi:hypothetical protein
MRSEGPPDHPDPGAAALSLKRRADAWSVVVCAKKSEFAATRFQV